MSLIRLVVVLFGLAVTGPALAHATLVSAHPVEGMTLANAPANVQLRFNEPVSPIAVHLIDSSGTSHELAFRSEGETVEATMPGDLPEGAQVLSYRVVSADGHPVGASFVFYIGHTGPSPMVAQGGPGRALAIWLDGAIVLNLLLGGIGMVAFFAFCAPECAASQPRPLILSVLAAGVFCVLAATGLQGLDLLDLSAPDLLSRAPWLAAGASPFALTAAAECLAFMVTATALATSSSRNHRWLAAIALLGVGLARAASGHAATAHPTLLTRPSVFLHTVTASLWAGALPGLLWIALRRRAHFQLALRRFSRMA